MTVFSKSIRPQDDLFGSVNADWLEENEIPSDKSSWGSFEILREKSEDDVHNIIKSLIDEDNLSGNEKKIADLFASFMDEERIEEIGLAPMKAIVEEVLSLSSVDEIISFSGAALRRGIGSFLSFYVWLDADNPKVFVPHISQAGIGLPDKAYYFEDMHKPVVEKYRDHLGNMHDLFGLDSDRDEWVDRVFGFESDIAKHHWNIEKVRDALATHNPRSAKELQDSFSKMTLWLDAVGLPEEHRDRILVAQPDYVKALSELLVDERFEDLKAWLTWRAMRSLSSYGPKELVDEDFSFSGKVMSGAEEIRKRYKRGISLVEGLLGEAVGKLYVEKHYPPEAREQMDVLIGHLLDAYRSSISSLPWMEEETREKALDKLSKFTPKVGAPETWRSYEDLRIDETDLVGNVLRGREFEFDYDMGRLSRPIDEHEWLMTPQTVNAYYSPRQNEIVFPAAILQPPFFSPDADPAHNYGAIGAVIGHEIGHGFDDQGSRYLGDGRLENWWTDEDRAAFEERTSSLINQFNGQTPRALSTGSDSDPGVNGELTLGENIGDLGGVGIALKAWHAYCEENPSAKEERDGLSADQRFFVGWANTWRTKHRDERARQLLAIDPHSPAEFRSNIVKNVDAFHEAFDTKEGDGMWLDPKDRVTIW